MDTTHSNTTHSNTTPNVRRLTAIAIVVALALSFAAAFVALGETTNMTTDGIFAAIGDYLTQVGEALGGG